MDGLFTSKMRYGIQLLGKVRMVKEDPVGADFHAIQMVQNNLLRTLDGSLVKDKVSIESMLNKFGMMSANQINASVKLLEVWKALKLENYPLVINRQETKQETVNTRANVTNRPIEIGKTLLSQITSVSDSIRIWNRALDKIIESISVHQAKTEIKTFVKTLPI